MSHSVENRFIAIVCAATLILVLPLFLVYLDLSSTHLGRSFRSNAEILVDTTAKALVKPVLDADADAVRDVAGIILRDSKIAAVSIVDPSGATTVTLPAGALPKGLTPPLAGNVTTADAGGMRTIATLRVWVRQPTLIDQLERDEIRVLIFLLIAVCLVFLAAIIGNRLTVIRPLIRLTAAIEATRRLGSRHYVDWKSKDEMGVLAHNFNEMQARLEEEEIELKRAHQRTTDIYNRTPAMLFSLDRDNSIIAVSDYWLKATGYRREQVIGTCFTDYISENRRDIFATRDTLATGLLRGQVWDVTVPFRKADGSMMMVLIVETRSLDAQDAVSLSVMTDITRLKEAETRNRAQAITDHLTGLLNRQGFEAELHEGIRIADEQNIQLACIFIDLDRFKWINDNFGHAAGDAVLREVSERIRLATRPGDSVSRLGGDEFAILVSARDVEPLAEEVGERICEMLREPIVVDGTTMHVSSSVGIALYPKHADHAADLLLKSDMAMYSRKRDGKNGKQIFDLSMLESARERREIEDQIESGLRDDWFDAYLQPIVSLSDGLIAGFEALMRLRHPEKGVLPPLRIIEIAEETGSIIAIGDRIMEKSITHLARISALEGTETTYLAVNFSPLQFEPSLPAKMAALLMKHGVAPSRIVIEITEAVLMMDNPHVHAVLKQLTDLGCRIALDDFGTGYSSLSYLNRFPVNIVKIDQSFITSLSNGGSDVRRKSRMLIKGIRTISHQMGCTVVAEGIETTEQWELLRKLGIDHGQGYLFSKPLSITDMMTMLEVESEAKTGSAA